MKPYADHFSGLARSYASYRPHYPTELFQYLASLSPRHELAWDCAAGTGQASLPLARWFRRVVATDASSAMIAQAQRHPHVEYRTALADRSGLESATVDLVTVAQALHWLELDGFYAEVKRVLHPNGVLAVWTYGVPVLEDVAMNSILQHFYYHVVGAYWPPDRRHVESGYRTLPFPFPELSPPFLVMQERWTLPELLGYIGTWSATQRCRETTGHDPTEALAAELGQLWGDADVQRTVSWPLSLRVGRAGG